jgi:predicted ribosomally synthesized peptide with nif11-like leader
MSVEDAKQYGKMIVEKEEVRKRAKEIGIADVEGQIAHARTLGLEFTTDDLQALAQEAGFSKDELSEEQLESIAGGLWTLTVGLALNMVAGAALVYSAMGVGSAVTAATGKW